MERKRAYVRTLHAVELCIFTIRVIYHVVVVAVVNFFTVSYFQPQKLFASLASKSIQ